MSKPRKATIQDIDGINHVVSAVRSVLSSIYKPLCNFESSDFEEDFKKLIFVVTDNEMDQIIGYLSLECAKSFQEDNEGDLIVVIHPFYQKQGNGTVLTEKAIEYIKKETKLNQIKAGIPNNNISSKKMLEKCGFNVLTNGEEKKIISNRFTMVRNIER